MATTMSDDARAFWNDEVGPKWVQAQGHLDAMMAPISERLFARLDAAAGQYGIDVGCGCGATTVTLAEVVGADGTALGVDVSAPMLEVAKASAADLPQARFQLADAGSHAFEAGRADRILSRFGVMFFADTRAAFANLAQALRPDGQLTFACWQRAEDNPWATFPVRAIADLVGLPAPSDEDAPGPFRFADCDTTGQMLRDAGFADVQVESFRPSLRLSGSVDALVDFFDTVGPLSRVLGGVDDTLRQRALDQVRAAMAKIHDGDGVSFDAATWIVSARRG